MITKLSALNKKYGNFMKKLGDGKNIEEDLENYMYRVERVEKQNVEIKNLIEITNKNMANCVQKIGIVRYNAFKDTGSDLSFALAMLDGNDSGWIINAMHSREGCYTYVKEIVKGESYVELAEEEAEALDKAIFHDIEKIEKSEIIEK